MRNPALTERNTDLALALIRIAAGVIFIAHGYQKLFEFGFGGVTQGFSGMGIPLPGIAAPFVTLLEFFGGIALVLGVGTRLVAALFAVEMLVALFMVHLKNGFFLPTGFEFVLILGTVSAGLALAGPGALSVDRALEERRARRL